MMQRRKTRRQHGGHFGLSAGGGAHFPPPPAPGSNCGLAAVVTALGTHGATSSATVDQWWRLGGLTPGNTYTLTELTGFNTLLNQNIGELWNSNDCLNLGTAISIFPAVFIPATDAVFFTVFANLIGGPTPYTFSVT